VPLHLFDGVPLGRCHRLPEERALTFAMGLHARLGGGSLDICQFRGDHRMQQRSSCTFASRSRYQEHHHHELASAEEAQRSRPLCLDVYSVRKMKWRIGLMPDILKRIRHQRATSFSRAVSSPE